MSDRKVIILEPENCTENCAALRDVFTGQKDVTFISVATPEGARLSKMLYDGPITEPKILLLKETIYQKVDGA